jgi:uncharacterized membrane protein YcaP (DUF421 family)
VEPIFNAIAAIGGVFLVQWLLAKARLNSSGIRDLLSNQPILLVENGEFLDAAMAATRVSRPNIFEKLRAAGVQSLSEVKAVVLETTGDISIMQKDVDEQLMQGVQRIDAAKKN